MAGFYAMDTNLDELPFEMREKQQCEIIDSLNSVKQARNIIRASSTSKHGQHGDSWEIKGVI